MPFLALFLHGRGFGIAAISAVLQVGMLIDWLRGRGRWRVGAGLLALAFWFLCRPRAPRFAIDRRFGLA